MNLSKSKYTLGIRCPKLLWLNEYKKNEAEDLGNTSTLEQGTLIGDLARNIFGKHTLIDYNKGLDSMLKDTIDAIARKDNVICEASFNYNGNFCSIDILKREKDYYDIYEVKSSTEIKDIYIDDISYQTWVLKKSNINIGKSYIVYVNSNYIYKDKLDLKKYFIIKDVTKELRLDIVEENINKYKNILSNNEPNTDLSISCHSPYDCPFFKYCTKDLVSPNVFDIGWSLSFKKKLELYNKNIISYKDLLDKAKLNDKQYRQVYFNLYNSSDYIDKQYIKELLNTFTYPLYFLDFESYQSAIPNINGTKPYQQIVFQYSLHYYMEYGGRLYHKEYLSNDYNSDPMYNLCKNLCNDIPLNSCILVYNDNFEKTRLKEMAYLYPEFKDHLLNIRDNIKDLLPPFKKGYYYTKNMQGSCSIKYVLPAMFPDDKTLDYHNLEQVHKGTEATESYLSLDKLSREEEQKLRCNMLKYCGLDTYAMVRIYEKLDSMTKDIS